MESTEMPVIPVVTTDSLEPTKMELQQLGQLFSKESEQLATMTGCNFDWLEK